MKMVNVYDFDTKIVSAIPAPELAPGMIEAEVEGIGKVWVQASKGKFQTEYQHPPFSDEVREILRRLRKIFHEFYPRTLDEWEDGFRKDRNPDREIAIWLRMGAVYEECTVKRGLTRHQREGYFKFILLCTTCERAHIFEVADLTAITREQADYALELFYSTSGE